MNTAWGALVVVVLVGCGPSVHRLVEQRHYREAVCAAADGEALERVITALDTDADLQAMVQIVDDPVVRAANERTTATVPVTLLRVDAQSNVLPLDDLTLSAAVGTLDGISAGLPVRWDVLAWWTGERLPAPHTTQTYLTLGNLFRLMLAPATAGMSLLFSDFHPDVMQIDAPIEEYRSVAPRAARLIGLTSSAGCVPLLSMTATCTQVTQGLRAVAGTTAYTSSLMRLPGTPSSNAIGWSTPHSVMRCARRFTRSRSRHGRRASSVSCYFYELHELDAI